MIVSQLDEPSKGNDAIMASLALLSSSEGRPEVTGWHTIRLNGITDLSG